MVWPFSRAAKKTTTPPAPEPTADAPAAPPSETPATPEPVVASEPPPGMRSNHVLSLTPCDEAIALDGDRIGTLRFLIGNTAADTLSLRSSIVARAPFDAAWCSITPATLDLEPGSRRELTVAIAVPRSAASGVRICHLVVWSVANPDEDFLTSVEVAITVPVPRSRFQLHIPWWVWTLAAILVIGAGNAVIAQQAAIAVQRIATPTRVGVPALTGLTLDQLLPALGPDLTPGVLSRRITGTVPFGAVLDQTPAATTVVAPGTPLDVVVENGLRLPDVTSKDVTAARTALTALGLTVTVRARRDDRSRAAFGTVLGQQPASGALVESPSTVVLDVLTGITVPDVRRQDPWQAQRALRALGLHPRVQLSSTTPTGDGKNGQVVVVVQSPAPGTQLAANSAVQLQLAWQETTP
jgi:beta-lactam-binding protein with PASTA domain